MLFRSIDQIKVLLKNKNCVLISDAGSPLISDPGYNLVQYCIANNIKVTSIPGPSSIISSLQLSGLPISEFSFFGFVPKSKKKIEDLVKNISQEKRTCVFFVSNHKCSVNDLIVYSPIKAAPITPAESPN